MTAKKIALFCLGLGLVLGLLLSGASCKRQAGQAASAARAAELRQEWFRYISAYSSGFVSRKSPIRVLFVNNVGPEGEERGVPAGVLMFDPDLSGRTEWKSPRELAFTPDRPLKPGLTHQAVLRLDKIMKVPREFKKFAFSFTAMPSNMEIQVEGLEPQPEAGPDRQVLRGVLITADGEEAALVEKALTAEQDGRELDIAWTHEGNGMRHPFLVKNVERKEAASAVRLSWDGRPIGVDNNGQREFSVTPAGQFELLEAEAVEGDPNFILLRFSDTLKKNQDLEGLISVESHPLTFETEGNVVRVYSARGFAGPARVRLEAGIRNFAEGKLGDTISRELSFKTLIPQVRFVGQGTILPQKDRLTVPIDAVNLKSVQVTAFQVFSHNMPQYFQLNAMEGNQELTRVGRFLWRKTIPLSNDLAQCRQWTRYSLDVTRLLQENPGSLFRLTLSFNRGNSTYPCPESGTAPLPEPGFQNQDDVVVRDVSSWDYAEDYFNEDRFDWADRNDPCRDAYYNPHFNSAAAVSRNFIASNIGLIAKLEQSQALHVVTTDLRTGRPLSGARVRAFDFQNRLLAEGTSDGSGFLTLKPAGRPFYISSQSGRDIGYLRLTKDGALAVSHFDVGGESVEKGIKGVIYGERGVWRPGDAIYLTFVLFDRDRILPKEHPVLLELSNPKGQLIQTYKPAKSLQSFHAFRLATDEDAPTGLWKAKVQVGGLIFSKDLRIETVVPNRLKIQFNPGRDVLVMKDMPLQASLTSQWLHGAPASDLKFDLKARFTSRPTRFARYQDYAFDDPAREFSGVEQDVFDGNLDEKGEARFPVKLAVEQPTPGALDATFLTRVFEETGEFSSDSLTLPFHPYQAYVGIKTPKGDEARGILLTDQDHVVNIVTLDPAGNPVSRNNLEARLYKISWKWWWDKSGESLAQYASATSTEVLLKGLVSTRNGEGQWKFQIKYPDWGRYLIRVYDPAGGHATGKVVYIDWPGWAGRAREEKGPGASRLSFTADKASYQVGDKAAIFLPEAPEGRALVSIENGSAVIKQMWVSTKQGENRFDLPLTADMCPNIYVHVTLLQPHSGKKTDTPIRLYGVIPVLVENPTTKLSPKLKLADELRPRQKFDVEVSEKDGRPMTYTLAVVDEGLLGLTRYATPDLHKEFFKREALGIQTWDLFDEVVEAYGAELSRLLAIGGGEEGGEEGGERGKRRFPPVVLFEGPFALAAGKTAVHSLTMPQYFGAVRVMAVAGSEGAYGLADKSVPVREDLMILPTLPRVVRPGEQADLPISVFVSTPDIKEVRVSVEPNDMFKMAGRASQTVRFNRPGDEIVSFSLITGPKIGQGLVRFRAVAGRRSVEDSVSIPILSANPRMVRSLRAEVEPGQPWQQAIVPFGLEGSNEVIVEVSAVPPINLEERLGFLVQYPHGCLEQTLSIAFPQLYLKNLVKLDPDMLKSLEKNINAAIGKLSLFQVGNGGFSYWPGGYEVHGWTSSYAGYFLLEAQRLGYFIPEAMLSKWKQCQKQAANVWTTGGPEEKMNQAFRLFTLALARDPDLGAMNRLRETESLNNTTVVLLAAAFHLGGQNDAAQDLLARCEWIVPRYRDDRYTFGSDLRDKALMVRILTAMGQRERAAKLVREIIPELGAERWFSTQETAFALMAVSDFYAGGASQPARFRLGWNGDAPQDMVSETPFFQKRYPGFPAKGRTLNLVNNSATKLYAAVYLAGIPPAGSETEAESNLKLKVEFQDLEGEAITPQDITQGRDFVMAVKVTNTVKRRLSNLVLSHLIPAGCQVSNPRLFTETPPRGYYDFQDVRDDRVYTYFGLESQAEKTFRVVLNASYSGRFYLPGLAVESMYDASYHANTKGQWIEIVK